MPVGVVVSFLGTLVAIPVPIRVLSGEPCLVSSQPLISREEICKSKIIIYRSVSLSLSVCLSVCLSLSLSLSLCLCLSLSLSLSLTLIPLSYGTVCVVVIALMKSFCHIHVALPVVLIVSLCRCLRGLGEGLSLGVLSVSDSCQLILVQLSSSFCIIVKAIQQTLALRVGHNCFKKVCQGHS